MEGYYYSKIFHYVISVLPWITVHSSSTATTLSKALPGGPVLPEMMTVSSFHIQKKTRARRRSMTRTSTTTSSSIHLQFRRSIPLNRASCLAGSTSARTGTATSERSVFANLCPPPTANRVPLRRRRRLGDLIRLRRRCRRRFRRRASTTASPIRSIDAASASCSTSPNRSRRFTSG